MNKYLGDQGLYFSSNELAAVTIALWISTENKIIQ